MSTGAESSSQERDPKRGNPTSIHVLFVCVGNAGRSQMAEAFAREQGINASSAGTVPAVSVNPVVVQVMRERGIDISAKVPRMLTTAMIEWADLVVTMGCSVDAACPRPMLVKLRKKLVEWHVDDPKGKTLEEVRRIRDEVEKKTLTLRHGGAADS